MNTFLTFTMQNRNCSHCGREVPDNKTFCTYCGYRVEKKPNIESPTKDQASNDKNKSNKTSYFWILIVVAIIIIAILGVIIPRYLQPNEPINTDLDKDGIPNKEDDYPKDYKYSVKLNVIDSNLYQLGNSYYVVMEFQNPRSYYVSNLEIFITLKTGIGSVVRTENTVFWSGNSLAPHAAGLSYWYFDSVAPVVTRHDITVKAAKSIEQMPPEKSNITLISHHGNYTGLNGTFEPKYEIHGTIVNLGSSEEIVNIWVGFYDENDKLLDVNFNPVIVGPGTDGENFSLQSYTYDANKIQKYEIDLVVELI